MSVVFRNPPLIEAICEFRFAPGQPWDWTVPGLLYARVKDEFPIKEQQQALELEFGPGAPPRSQMVSATRVHFIRSDKIALIQVGENMLIVNHLRPYPQWEQYRQMILDNFEKYSDVATPNAIFRIDLRYINKIEFPAPPEGSLLKIRDYIHTFPGLPESLKEGPIENFVQRVQIRLPATQNTLTIQAGTIPPDQAGNAAFLLDLDITSDTTTPIPLNGAEAWIEQAHTEVEKAFLDSVTSKAQEIFEEINDEQPSP